MCQMQFLLAKGNGRDAARRVSTYYHSHFTIHHSQKKHIFAPLKIVSPKPKIMNIIIYLLLGALAGWLAGKIMKGSGNGLIVNIIVGIIGGFLGGWLMSLVGLEGGSQIWQFITAVIGACLLLFILSLFRRK